MSGAEVDTAPVADAATDVATDEAGDGPAPAGLAPDGGPEGTPDGPPDTPAAAGVGRRRALLGLVAAGVTGAAAVTVDRLRGDGATADADTDRSAPSAGRGPAVVPVATAAQVVPFRGAVQAGITTAVQDRMQIAAFDVLPGTTMNALMGLLQRWTTLAERMSQGLEAVPDGAVGGSPAAPPEDTGEALGLPAARLTVTLGFGASLFDARFGLSNRRPDALEEFPRLPGDALVEARGGGDLVVQACADDQQVAVHAIRMLTKAGFGVVRLRWNQLGYGRTSSTTPEDVTPRNLFGFKDGTRNIKADQTGDLDRYVWVPPGEGPAWMAGGTYLVARRIRMLIEIWDRTSLREQEDLTGRNKLEGAPYGRALEHDDVDPTKLPPTSHVALMHVSNPAHGTRVLRRGYSFVDGSDDLGRLDAGLFFVGFVRHPGRQLLPMLREMATKDILAVEYLRTTSSGVYAIPPGLAAGQTWADHLSA